MQSHRPGLATYPLSLTQRNEVMLLVGGWQLDPKDFEWNLARTWARQIGPGWEHPTVDRLTHKPTRYFFQFDFDTKMRHHAYYRPGKDTPEHHAVPGTWEEQRKRVNDWASYVKREYETPDAWAELGQRGALGAPPHGVANTGFSQEEQTQIAAILHAALASAPAKDELTPEQDRALEEELDEILQATKRLGRLDFRSFVIGALVEVMVAEAIPPGLVRHVLEFTLRGVFQLVSGADFPELPRPGG